MVEAIVVAIFLVIFLALQYNDRAKIQITAVSTKGRKIFSIIVAVMLVVLIHPQQAADLITLIIFGVLIVALAFFPQGLGTSELICFGLISIPYNKIKEMEIEQLKHKQIGVTFHHVNNRTVKRLIFAEDENVLRQFLYKKLLQENVHVVK